MAKRTASILLFVGLIAVEAPLLRALRPNRPLSAYGLHVFTTENGLPQSAVMALCQVHAGFLWLGTYEGLARFDGRNFRIFDKLNVPVMRNNSIKCFLEDRENRLWIGTPNGLLMHHRGRFRLTTTDDGLSDDFVLSLFEDSRGRIWVGTTHGLNLLGNRGAVAFLPGKETGSNYIAAITEDSRGRIWVGTEDGLLVSRDPFKGDWQRVLPHDIRVLYHDPNGGIWAGSSGRGLFFLPDDSRPVTRSRAYPGSNDVRAVFRDRHGVLWIGTNGGGLVRVHGSRVENLTSRQGLPGDSVRSIIEDHEGSLWVGTRNGLAQLTDDRYTLFNSRNGLPVDEVRCVLPGEDGGVWIGTVDGGLVRYRDGTFKTYNARQGLRSERIWSLASDGAGGVWIGTYGAGLHHLDRNGRVRVWTRREGLANNIVRAILVEENGRVWAGTNGGGVAVLEKGRVVRRYSRENGMPSDFIYAIARDRRGGMWFGTYDAGLVELRRGQLHVYGAELGLDAHAIWAIHPDPDRNLWLGTDDGGLKRFYGGRVDVFTLRDGLYSDSAFQILDDGRGSLWMNCNQGVFHVRTRDLLEFSAGKLEHIPCTAFGRSEGIRVIETSGPAQPAGCMDSRGRLWFPTINGVAVFDPAWKPETSAPPPVAIERLRINRREFLPGETAVVPPGKGNLEVEWAGFSFRLAAGVQFRYRLVGHDNEWTETGPRRFAAIANLSPGTYRFEVGARLQNGAWNPETATAVFRLRPRFVQTVWFFLLAGLIFLALVALAYWVNLHHLRRRQRHLSAVVDERTSQLNNANQRLNQINIQLQEANMKLKHLAHMDGVTQIANHRFFLETLEREWRLSVRQSLPLGLLLGDIDFFKDFNDSRGHQAGDHCLQAVARALQDGLKRPRDFVARYGGEEFVVILPGTDGEGARVTAEKLRAAVESLRIPHGASAVSEWVTISLGAASSVPSREDNAMSLLKAADQALYAAKRAGRNTVVFQAAPK